MPTDIIPSRILACYPSLISLRVNTATTSQLKGLRIKRLTIDHYQLDDREAPLHPPETHPIIPWLPKLTHLCIHADGHFKAAPFRLLDGQQLPKLTHLSLKGNFGDFYLGGSWSQLRSLTVLGKFRDLRWIAHIAPYIQQLSISARRYDYLPFDDDLLGIDFDRLEVLELHWCNLKKFPNGARIRRLTHYSESREIGRRSGELDLLKNIDLHLEKLQLLTIRAQCGMDDSGETGTLNMDQTYGKLREIRNQQGCLKCLIQAPALAPATKDSWLRHASAPMLWFKNSVHSDNLQTWQSERLELLRKADLQSKFAETRGEDFRAPFAPHPLGFVVPFGIDSEHSFGKD